MSISKLCAGTLAATLVAAGGSVGAHAEPLLISYAVWVGYGPLFVAKEKGFFDDEGLDVQMIRVEEGVWEGLFDGQVDVMATTLDDVAAWFKPDQKPVCVLALDESLGGDGIVAIKDIKDIAELKDKAVAYQRLSVSQFYLSVLLQEQGLSAEDIQTVEAVSQDAADAFMLGEVDAVVTWEPWLSEAAKTEYGHLLVDSSERPGLIVDCMVTTTSLFEERKGEFQALARAWARAVDYYEAHPAEAIGIMARHVGGWLEDPAAFAETLKGVRLYGRERNETYFGTPRDPGPVYDTAQKAIDVWSSVGQLNADISPSDMIGHGVWDQ